MPTQITAFIDSEIRMRFREPYVTEGINQKMAHNTARGVYKGFRLGVDVGAGTNTIEIVSDPNTFDHAAVYTDSDGHAVSIYRSTGDFLVDLTPMQAGFAKTVAICLLADYTIGSPTTGTIQGYEITPTDEFTVATEYPELIVLGTVVIPAGGGVITATNINHDFRRGAWDGIAAEAVTWSPVIRNGSFQWAEPASSDDLGAAYWRKPAPTGAIEILNDATDPRTGTMCAAWSPAVSSGMAADLEQVINIPVIPGQLIKLQLWKKNLQVPVAGSYRVRAKFADDTGALTAEQEFFTIDVSGVDGTYTKLEAIMAVPAGDYQLSSVFVSGTGLEYSAATLGLLVDDIQVWVEPMAHDHPNESLYEQRIGDLQATSVVLTDQSELAVSDLTSKAAQVEYDAGLDRVVVKGRSGTTDPELRSLADIVAVGTVTGADLVATASLTVGTTATVEGVSDLKDNVTLGANILADAAEARTARIDGVLFTGDFTLLQEWQDGAGKALRIYSNDSGAMNVTRNASWDGTNWSKDVNGEEATRFVFGDPVRIYKQLAANDAPWATASWDVEPFTARSTGGEGQGTVEHGGQTTLGAGLGNAAAELNVPLLYSSKGDLSGSRMLLWEMNDEISSGTTIRMYHEQVEYFLLTINARWDNTDSTWYSDDSNDTAVKYQFHDTTGFSIYMFTSPGASWTETTFDSNLFMKLDPPDGLQFGPHATKPGKTTGRDYWLTKGNLVRVWAEIDTDGVTTSPSSTPIVDGYNCQDIEDIILSTLQLDYQTALGSSSYCILVWYADPNENANRELGGTALAPITVVLNNKGSGFANWFYADDDEAIVNHSDLADRTFVLVVGD